MCGFAGYLSDDAPENSDCAETILRDMGSAIVARGPDDFGFWHNRSGIGLAHCRLSVLDLSYAGHQPMTCHSDRYVVVFNGEIYNHLELRREVEETGNAPVWRGHSDTETLLVGFLVWGIRSTIERCVGMFAFAVWDKLQQTLTLGRDRLGEKPLYYGWQNSKGRGYFLFGSDLNALKKHPAFEFEISRDSLALFMERSYVPCPHSIYQGIRKLSPGCLLKVSASRPEPVIERYWSLVDAARYGISNPLCGSVNDVVTKLEAVLGLAVRRQMLADVPLGAFLSGGVDSSTVAALMQSHSSRPIKTFSIGFNEKEYNEAEYAKNVARCLGTEHTEMYVTSADALNVIPKLPGLYSEPFADSSQIPTYLLSQLARQNIKVALTGDGADELFGGYSRYVQTQNLLGRALKLPRILRRFVGAMVLKVPSQHWDLILSKLSEVLPRSLKLSHPGDSLHKAAGILGANGVSALYGGLVTHWDSSTLVIGANPLTVGIDEDLIALVDGLNPIHRMMVLDAITYLPDDILVKLDRATMGTSLESRVPFLDHSVVEFAWQIPQAFKINAHSGKWILRQLLYRYVDKDLIERPKQGFSVPIDQWLRGPLRDWAESLIDESRLVNEGYLNPKPIRLKWQEHITGKRNWQHHLWDVLMFQSWLELKDR